MSLTPEQAGSLCAMSDTLSENSLTNAAVKSLVDEAPGYEEIIFEKTHWSVGK